MCKNIQSTYIEVKETKQSVTLSRSLEGETGAEETTRKRGKRLQIGKYDQLNGQGVMLGRHYVSDERVVPLR